MKLFRSIVPIVLMLFSIKGMAQPIADEEYRQRFADSLKKELSQYYPNAKIWESYSWGMYVNIQLEKENGCSENWKYRYDYRSKKYNVSSFEVKTDSVSVEYSHGELLVRKQSEPYKVEYTSKKIDTTISIMKDGCDCYIRKVYNINKDYVWMLSSTTERCRSEERHDELIWSYHEDENYEAIWYFDWLTNNKIAYTRFCNDSSTWQLCQYRTYFRDKKGTNWKAEFQDGNILIKKNEYTRNGEEKPLIWVTWSKEKGFEPVRSSKETDYEFYDGSYYTLRKNYLWDRQDSLYHFVDSTITYEGRKIDSEQLAQIKKRNKEEFERDRAFSEHLSTFIKVDQAFYEEAFGPLKGHEVVLCLVSPEFYKRIKGGLPAEYKRWLRKVFDEEMVMPYLPEYSFDSEGNILKYNYEADGFNSLKEW